VAYILSAKPKEIECQKKELGVNRDFLLNEGCIDSVVSLRNMGSISNDSVSAIEGSMCVGRRTSTAEGLAKD
jgi:hypothetical protein